MSFFGAPNHVKTRKSLGQLIKKCPVVRGYLAGNLRQLFWPGLKNKSVEKNRCFVSIFASNFREAFWCWNTRCNTRKLCACNRKILSYNGISSICRYHTGFRNNRSIAGITPQKSLTGSLCFFHGFRLYSVHLLVRCWEFLAVCISLDVNHI